MKVKTAEATIHFRLLNEQKDLIVRAAKESGQSLSDYSRATLLAAANYTAAPLPEQEVFVSDSEKDDVKREVHCIRTTKQEWEFYESQAERIGCSASEYIRMCANGKSIQIIPGFQDVAKQIAKLGVNLNQLTMLAHQGRIKEVDLFPTNDTLKQILKQLNRLAGKER